jgi:hypothetical protein
MTCEVCGEKGWYWPTFRRVLCKVHYKKARAER